MEKEIKEASTFGQFAEIFKRYKTETRKISRSIAYDPQSQIIIIRLRKILRQYINEMSEDNPSEDIDDNILYCSRYFNDRLSLTLTEFKIWKMRRMDLIKKSEASANHLQWTVLLGSMSRIIMSTVDLVASIMSMNGSEKRWVQLALKYSTILSFSSLLLQALVSTQIFDSIKTSFEKDKQLFLPIKEWFDLPIGLNTVNQFFPYRIDPKIVAEIEKSSRIPDESAKIFMSVVASNVAKSVGLLRDKNFLTTVEMFSTSELGAKWYRKILIEIDPLYIECFKYDLENQIKEMDSKNTISKAENIFYSTLPMQIQLANFKVIFDALAIFSAVCSLFHEKSRKDSETMKEFSAKAKYELVSVTRAFVFLSESRKD